MVACKSPHSHVAVIFMVILHVLSLWVLLKRKHSAENLRRRRVCSCRLIHLNKPLMSRSKALKVLIVSRKNQRNSMRFQTLGPIVCVNICGSYTLIPGNQQNILSVTQQQLMWSTGSGSPYICVCLLCRNNFTHGSSVSLGDNDERTEGAVEGRRKPISQPHIAHAKLQGFLGNISTLLYTYKQKVSCCCKLVPNNMKCIG